MDVDLCGQVKRMISITSGGSTGASIRSCERSPVKRLAKSTSLETGSEHSHSSSNQSALSLHSANNQSPTSYQLDSDSPVSPGALSPWHYSSNQSESCADGPLSPVSPDLLWKDESVSSQSTVKSSLDTAGEHRKQFKLYG
jgi:hypothetical protein